MNLYVIFQNLNKSTVSFGHPFLRKWLYEQWHIWAVHQSFMYSPQVNLKKYPNKPEYFTWVFEEQNWSQTCIAMGLMLCMSCKTLIGRRLQYCWRCLHFAYSSLHNLNYESFSNEVQFQLSGHIRSQNNRFWNFENLYLFHERPLHFLKVRVQCALSQKHPPTHTHTHSDSQSSPEHHSYWQMLNATAGCSKTMQQHTADDTTTVLHEFFGERIISCGLWQPRYTNCLLQTNLRAHLKENVYKNNPCILSNNDRWGPWLQHQLRGNFLSMHPMYYLFNILLILHHNTSFVKLMGFVTFGSPCTRSLNPLP